MRGRSVSGRGEKQHGKKKKREAGVDRWTEAKAGQVAGSGESKGCQYKGVIWGCVNRGDCQQERKKTFIKVESRQLISQGGFHHSAVVEISGRKDNSHSWPVHQIACVSLIEEEDFLVFFLDIENLCWERHSVRLAPISPRHWCSQVTRRIA